MIRRSKVIVAYSGLRRGPSITSAPLSSRSRERTRGLAGTVLFGDQARKAWQIDEIESVVLAREHCDGGLLEAADMIPCLFERDRIVLCDRREYQISEEAQPANQ